MDKLEFESMTLCPLDGRYGKIKDQLADYFSEYARLESNSQLVPGNTGITTLTSSYFLEANILPLSLQSPVRTSVVGAFAVVGYTDSNGAQLISYASSSVTFSPLYDTAFSSL